MKKLLNLIKKTGTLIPGVVAVFLLYSVAQGSGFLFDFFQENERLHQELIGEQTKFESLSKVVGKMGVKYVEQNTLRKEVSKQFADSNQALIGRIKVLSKATWAIKSKARESDAPDLTFTEGKNPYVMVEVRLDSGLPLGYVLIYDSGKVVSKAYNYELNAHTAISRDEDSGKYTILTKLDHTLKSPTLNTNGEKIWFNMPYGLKISGGVAFIDPTEPSKNKPRFWWWAPRLNPGMSLGFGSGQKFSLRVSLMGFGPSRRDLDFKFLGVGMSYVDTTREFQPSLEVLAWRPFREFLPNTYIGAGVDFDLGVGGVDPFVNLSFGF